MAPTAILATQHLENYKKMFNQFGIKCELLISAITKKKKQELLERLESGEIDTLIVQNPFSMGYTSVSKASEILLS